MPARAWVFALACVACGSAKPPAPASRRIETPPQVTFASPAARYNEPVVAPPSTPLVDAVLDAVRASAAQAGRAAPIADERVSMAAAALASVAPPSGSPSYPVVEFALHSNGVIEPSPHILIVWGHLQGRLGIAMEFRIALDKVFRREHFSRVGVAGAIRAPGRGDVGAVVLVLVQSGIQTKPFPRAVQPNGSVDLDVVLAPGRTEPRVSAILPNGEVEVVEVQPSSERAFAARVACGGATGTMHIEIRARGTELDTLAKFPVWCGAEPPRTFVLERDEALPVDPAQGARRIAELVNLERGRMGRELLAWDDTLAKAALDHAEAMRDTGIVSHRLPEGPSIDERVRALGERAPTTGSVARAFSISEVHRGLAELPSTRQGLISPGATRFGVGVAYGFSSVGGVRAAYVVQVLAAPASE